MSNANAAGPEEAREGIARVEGYLLWRAEMDRARTDAQNVADALEWPTTAQREDLVRVLTGAYLDRSRVMLAQTAKRAAELRSEYQARYERLRRRFLASALGCCALFLFVASLLSGR